MTRTNTKRTATALCAAAAMALGVTACGGDDSTATIQAAAATTSSTPGANLPQGSEPVNLDPAEFTTQIDNPYWPMSPGSKWVFRETDTQGGEERVVVEVTDKTKTIANGVEARVIRDVVTDVATGEVIEATDDWHAEDADGNVWYLGEATAEYKNGQVSSTAGSSEAGVDGAQAGIAIPGRPPARYVLSPGVLEGHRRGRGRGDHRRRGAGPGAVRSLRLGRRHDPRSGPSRAEGPGAKFYVPDVGPVLSVHTDGAGGRAELVSYTPGT